MAAPLTTVLLVDDDSSHRKMLRMMLEDWGYGVTEACDGEEAVAFCRERLFDVVLMDIRMPKLDGMQALRGIKQYNPAVPVLIMTAYSNIESAVEAIKNGAYDYFTKPLDFEKLQVAIGHIIERAALIEKNTALEQSLSSLQAQHTVIGHSRAMRDMLQMLLAVAASQATVLITGESGTGKEVAARTVHGASPRSKAPFVAVNCAALTESLLESELFGHEKGAFTGADKLHEGCFMRAHGGTLFLDEIGEMPLPMQAKLLRVLQEREVTRVGGNKSLPVDVRIIAATNRNLREEVEKGNFREDLFYRLNVVAIEVPPLRKREEDIPLLAQYFITKFGSQNNKQVSGVSPKAMDALVRYSWPGNVRELENVIERAVVLMLGDQIAERDIPEYIRNTRRPLEHSGFSSEGADKDNVEGAEGVGLLEDIEKKAIFKALEASSGNKSEAAKLLGITRKTLHAKLQKYEREG